MKRHQALAAAAAFCAWSAGPASAQDDAYPSICAAREDMVRFLEVRYGETLQGAGRQTADAIMELYVSDNGSWTMIITRRDGMSCPIAAGEDWRQLELAPSEPAGEPA